MAHFVAESVAQFRTESLAHFAAERVAHFAAESVAQFGAEYAFALTGYYKLYAVRKSIRVVYRIVEDEVIVEIVGIGKRADFEVYADVARRLLRKE